MMKCPYMDFKDCIVEQCPSCNYKENKNEVIEGRFPSYMSAERAISEGNAWISTKTTYEFVSCKLIDNNVQPIPSKKELINNTTRTNVVVKQSIF